MAFDPNDDQEHPELSTPEGYSVPDEYASGISQGKDQAQGYYSAAFYVDPLQYALASGASSASIPMSTLAAGGTYRFGDGTVTSPAISWLNETNSGRYRIGLQDFGESVNGVLTHDWNTTRMAFATGYKVGVACTDPATALEVRDPSLNQLTLSKDDNNAVQFLCNGTGMVVSQYNNLGFAPEYDFNGDNLNGTPSLRIKNLHTSGATSHAWLVAEVGGSSAGDPVMLWDVDFTQVWAAGIDNSDSQKWKLCEGSALGTNDRITVYPTSGNIAFGTGSFFWDNTNSILQAPNLQLHGVPWFDVKFYGAKGDGTTDDTSAIDSAMSAAASAGKGVVYFPPGRYKRTTTLNIAGVIVKGDGANGATGSVSTFSGIEYTGSGAAIAFTDWAGALIDMHVKNTSAGASSIGISIGDNIHNTYVKNCTVVANANATGSIGYQILAGATGSYGNRVVDSSFSVWDTGLKLDSSGASNANANVFSNVLISNIATACININKGIENTFTGIHCDTFSGATGLLIGAASNLNQFSGRMEGGSTSKSYSVTAGATNNTIFVGDNCPTASTDSGTTTAIVANGKFLGTTATLSGVVSGGTGGFGGVTSPARNLEVLDASNPQLRLTQAAGSIFVDQQINSSGNFVFKQTGGSLNIYEAPSPDFIITGTAANQALMLDFYDNAVSTLKARFVYAGANGGGSRYFGMLNEGADYIAISSDSIRFLTSPGTFSESFRIDVNQILSPQVSQTTGMTKGFINIPTAAGVPTGTPATTTGSSLYYDSTNHKLMVYDTIAGAWKGVVVA